jgi:hypothetical protein
MSKRPLRFGGLTEKLTIDGIQICDIFHFRTVVCSRRLITHWGWKQVTKSKLSSASSAATIMDDAFRQNWKPSEAPGAFNLGQNILELRSRFAATRKRLNRLPQPQELGPQISVGIKSEQDVCGQPRKYLMAQPPGVWRLSRWGCELFVLLVSFKIRSAESCLLAETFWVSGCGTDSGMKWPALESLYRPETRLFPCYKPVESFSCILSEFGQSVRSDFRLCRYNIRE